MMNRRRDPWLVAVLAIALSGCTDGPILANPPQVFPTPVPATPAPSRPADPKPVVLPRDDGPHDRLTEWWYYTGHLATADGRRFGFEAVIFRAERGDVPVTWASHLALTDENGQRFLYGQRSEIGPQVDRSPRDATGAPTGFDLAVGGPTSPGLGGAIDPAAAPWRLAGSNGSDRIEAALSPAEAGLAGGTFGLRLELDSTKPAVLHDDDGWVEFGPAGGSYYYSRTRLAVDGELTLDEVTLPVTGIAWFDHQWGDFISVGGGGWDWFAINLADGTDLTISIVRDASGEPVLRYGTLVAADGGIRHLEASDLSVEAGATWTSPRTGRSYPIEWHIDAALDVPLVLHATLPDQELDTRATTGVVYWEGSHSVSGRGGRTGVSGQAYVEITRYGT
ncbi:MAG TPA: lipocalin-like domain-containing protein [Candidatus Deferrimicrobiaceae bacterium]|nr:lipocalin-like domain-containing protein [Candidatus Deferrimicrobiaceae bacterium]